MAGFDKKHCHVCGKKVGFLSREDIEDGVICDDCAEQLSPLGPEPEMMNVSEVKRQLDYREKNKERVRSFQPTFKYDLKVQRMRVLIDENDETFMVTDCADNEMRTVYPDVIDLADITECQFTYNTDDDYSYFGDDSPYIYEYDFYLEIHLDHPYINEIKLRLNDDSEFIHHPILEKFNPVNYPQCERYMDTAEELMDALLGEDRKDDLYTDESGNSFKLVKCPWCDSKCAMTRDGRCPNCGGNLDA